MKAVSFVIVSLFIFSATVSAAEVFSIRIFQNDAIRVQQDIRLPSGVIVHVHNMDAKEHSEKKLTEMVKSKVGSGVKKEALKDAYMQAFSEVQNGPQWQSIYQDIVASAEPEEKAVRFGIKKLPAIMFNDKSIVYGVTSLNEAVRIYENKGGNQ